MTALPEQSQVDLSVVVCTRNRAELLADCLRSLTAQTLDPSRFEVIVVDNDSTDDTRQVAAVFMAGAPNFSLIFEPEPGHSQARNRGWRQARARYVAFIDDDCIADAHWCERIIHAFVAVEPPPDAVGGKVLPRFESPPPAWFSSDLEVRQFGSSAGYQEQCAAYGFSGANMAFPREVLEQLDGFSLRFGMVDGRLRMGEDTDFFVRMRTRGRRRFWYDPDIQVSHMTPADSLRLSGRLRRSFLCGCSHAYLSGSSWSLLDQGKLLLSVPLRLGRGLVALLTPVRYRVQHPVRHFQDAAHQLGLLLESCRASSAVKDR